MKLAIVDYGAGNLGSVVNAFGALGEEALIARTPEAVLVADRLVLPGTGAAGPALARLRASGLDQALAEAVRVRGRPLLGICLGMEMLAQRLYEFGEHEGLGWIAGEFVDLRSCVGNGLRVPHMGWNRVEPTIVGAALFSRLRAPEFYFAHSFTLRASEDGIVAAHTPYGISLVSAVRKDTVFATQFHPEKSQVDGERLLAAFLEWAP